MKVTEFDIKRGIYRFELTEIKTEFHSHPALELLYSAKGNISIFVDNERYDDISFAVIDRNVRHKVIAEDDLIFINMLECSLDSLLQLRSPKDLVFRKGIAFKRNKLKPEELLLDIVPPATTFRDERVNTCLKILNGELPAYEDMVNKLTQTVYLSESRLSHLFKSTMGISLKKYLVWCRLKSAFHLVLKHELNMHQAALRSGFFDQAHLSKAFRQLFGMAPSQVYNSRTLQE